jgi:hypothetical protein
VWRVCYYASPCVRSLCGLSLSSVSRRACTALGHYGLAPLRRARGRVAHTHRHTSHDLNSFLRFVHENTIYELSLNTTNGKIITCES